MAKFSCLPLLLLGLACISTSCTSTPKEVAMVSPMALHQLCFTGPSVSETGDVNPFLDVRLLLELKGPGVDRTIPGFFAADGNSAHSGADEGNQWCVNVREAATGDYTYTVSFQQDTQLALKPTSIRGTSLAPDGKTGSFRVSGSLSHPGWLTAGTNGYPRFSESGKIFIKTGTNSPENFLAYKDFDGTYSYDTSKVFTKSYDNHVSDWKSGDPSWKEDQGKGIIGALNYLASQGVNSIYTITMNIGGDARDVWPYVDHETFDRFDVSKLAQWDLVYKHAQDLGIVLHIQTQETENETLLDMGDTGEMRQLYYRELVARFGHHPFLIWDLGEENGKTPWKLEDPAQNTSQRMEMAAWFAKYDPYEHPVIIHTLPNPEHKPPVLDPLLKDQNFDGLSMQIYKSVDVHSDVARWRHRSDSAGHRWMLGMDEIGPWYSGSLDDIADPKHDTLRKEVLYGALFSGAYGVEWYFGWLTVENDLNAENFRTREALWKQSVIAREFFDDLPLEEMEPRDDLISNKGYVLSAKDSLYAVYLPERINVRLNIKATPKDQFRIEWTDPLTGEYTTSENITGNEDGVVLFAPAKNQDWLARIERIKASR